MKKTQKRLDDILELVAKGKSNAEIAKVLGFSLITIKKDVSFLLKKYKVRSRIELAIEYMSERLASY